MAARYVAVVHPGRPPYTLRHPKNLRRMVREREFSLSLNVRHLHGYITRRYRAGGTGKSDSGGTATLGKLTSREISAEVASSTFRARQPEIVEYAPPPLSRARKMAGRSGPGGASTAEVGARRCYDMCRGAALVTGLASHRGRGAAVAGAAATRAAGGDRRLR